MAIDGYTSTSHSPKHEMAVLLFNMVHLECKEALKVTEFQTRKTHLKHAVAIMD